MRIDVEVLLMHIVKMDSFSIIGNVVFVIKALIDARKIIRSVLELPLAEAHARVNPTDNVNLVLFVENVSQKYRNYLQVYGLESANMTKIALLYGHMLIECAQLEDTWKD